MAKEFSYVRTTGIYYFVRELESRSVDGWDIVSVNLNSDHIDGLHVAVISRPVPTPGESQFREER